MQSVKQAKPTIRLAVLEKLVTGGSYKGDKKVMSCFFISVLTSIDVLGLWKFIELLACDMRTFPM